MSLLSEVRELSAANSVSLEEHKKNISDNIRSSAERGDWDITVFHKELGPRKNEVLDWLKEEGFTLEPRALGGGTKVSWSKSKDLKAFADNEILDAQSNHRTEVYIKTEGYHPTEVNALIDHLSAKGYSLTPRAQVGVDGMNVSWVEE